MNYCKHCGDLLELNSLLVLIIEEDGKPKAVKVCSEKCKKLLIDENADIHLKRYEFVKNQKL